MILPLSENYITLVFKKDSSFKVEDSNIFYPGDETNYHCYIDGIRVAWCEGAIRQKINSGMSYFLSVIETKHEYQNKSYSRKMLNHIHKDLGLPITPINVNNPDYWKYICSCAKNNFIVETPLCEQELEDHKIFWRRKK